MKRKFTKAPVSASAEPTNSTSSASTVLSMLSKAGIDTTKHQYVARSVDSDGEVSELRFYAPGDWMALWVTQTGDVPTFESMCDRFNGVEELIDNLEWHISKYPSVDKFRFGEHVTSWSNQRELHTFELYNNDTGDFLIGDYFISDVSEYDW